MLKIFRVYIFLTRNFQGFLKDLICLLKEGKVFSFRWKICRCSLTIWFVSWLSRRSVCVSGSMNGTEWKKVGWGKKFIERERKDMIDTFAVKKKKWNLFQSKKKCTRRVVYKWQESTILFKRVLLLNHDVSNSHCYLIFLRFLWRSCHESEKKVFNRINNILWIHSLCWTFFTS